MGSQSPLAIRPERMGLASGSVYGTAAPFQLTPFSSKRPPEKMSKERRSELIRKVEETRNSYVITYVLSDRPNATGRMNSEVVREIYDVARDLKPFDRKRTLDLFILGMEGDQHVPWQILSMLREMFREISVIAPYKAHGPATMLALGADTVFMGETSELSLIDIPLSDATVRHSPHEKPDIEFPLHANDILGLMSLVERLGKMREKQRIDTFLRALDKVSPLLLGHLNRTLEQTKTICLKLLRSRRRPFRKRLNRRIVEKICSPFSSGQHCICMTEAVKEIGLKHVKRSEGLESVFWELLTLYEEAFNTREPFYPEEVLEQTDEEEKVFRDHRVAYVETTARSRAFLRDVKVRKIRQYAPEISFNPQIILPALEIAPGLGLGENSILAFIQQWLQNNLPGIVNECFHTFSKGFPVIAYERLFLNQRWIDE